MSTPKYQLAQLNVARAKAPLDTPVMEGFVSQLDTINALAERSEGFVWRLQTEDGNATSIRASDDPLLIVNMSVWESLEALRSYVYRSDHMNVFRNRASWFEKIEAPILVLWWVPQGTLPRVEQGMARLKYLRLHGPSQLAFTFKDSFPAPDGDGIAEQGEQHALLDPNTQVV